MSIVTDQVQGIAVTVLFIFLVIYMAATFRYYLPTPYPDDCCTTCPGAWVRRAAPAEPSLA